MAATLVYPEDFPIPEPARTVMPADRPRGAAGMIVPLKAGAAVPARPEDIRGPASRAAATTLRLDGVAARWDFLPARQDTAAGRHLALPPELGKD